MEKVLAIILICFSSLSMAQIIPFENEQWEIESKGAIFDRIKGVDCLYLDRGAAVLKDVEFENGIIEFDMLVRNRRAFPGLIFRMTDPKNYESFYIRPFLSGKADANQYTPFFNGVAGWQLYHGSAYASPVEYTYDEWIHFKFVISGTQAEVYIGNTKEPSLFINELKHGLIKGRIGVSVSTNPVHFANFSYQHLDSPPLKGKPSKTEEAQPNTIMNWEVSTTFPEAQLENKTDLGQLASAITTWQKLNCEKSGLANLAKIGMKEGKTNTVFAKVILSSDQKQIKKLDFGYSDRVRVYLNGQLLYSGQNEWRSRDYRYLGTVGFFDSVYLNLKKGDNELIMAVSENFGGWGLKAKLTDFDGIEINPNQ